MIKLIQCPRFFALTLLLCCLHSSYIQAQPISENAQQQTLPLEDLQVFTEVFNLIRTKYVESVSDSQLFEDAINGMLSQLDPYSSYLNDDQLHELVDTTRGSFSGIGVRLQKNDDLLIIKEVIEGSPADKAQLESGDIILKINNTITDNISLAHAGQLLKGKENSKLTIHVLNPTSNITRSVKLKRKNITYLDVQHKHLEANYEYIRIGRFQENTGKKVRDILLSFYQQPIKGLILDLRNNPGGLLNSAIDVTDLFVRKGIIVYTQGRDSHSRKEYLATNTDISKNINVVVLINQNSASAAEIVAGALQDKQRAIIVGTTSFGKGSVQTVIPITESRAIKLTTSLYYTPSGRVINVKGIQPDIVVENNAQQPEQDAQLTAGLNELKRQVLQQEREATRYLQKVE